ncbi:hypothetical protein D3C72_2233040 [compost metagenome]
MWSALADIALRDERAQHRRELGPGCAAGQREHGNAGFFGRVHDRRVCTHWRPEHEAGGVLGGEGCEQLDDFLALTQPDAEHERTV